MKYTWLEKLAADGSIRPEALKKIYENCSDVLGRMDKTASFDSEKLLKQIAGIGLTAGVFGALAASANELNKIRQDYKVRAQTDLTKQRVLKNPRFMSNKDKEKAEARFVEIIKYAPSLGPNEAVMNKLVADKLNTGLSNQDVQNLISIQVKMTPNPLEYARLTQEKTASHLCGEALANCYLELEKTALLSRSPSTIANVSGHIMRTLSVPLALTAGIAGAQYVKGKVDEKELRGKLADSFQRSMSESQVLQANPEKAKNAFISLSHFAPHIASEPNAALAFMEKIVGYNKDQQSLHLHSSDLKELTEIERNMGSTKPPGMLDTIDKSMAASGLPRIMASTWHETMSPYQKRLNEDIEHRISKE